MGKVPRFIGRYWDAIGTLLGRYWDAIGRGRPQHGVRWICHLPFHRMLPASASAAPAMRALLGDVPLRGGGGLVALAHGRYVRDHGAVSFSRDAETPAAHEKEHRCRK